LLIFLLIRAFFVVPVAFVLTGETGCLLYMQEKSRQRRSRAGALLFCFIKGLHFKKYFCLSGGLFFSLLLFSPDIFLGLE
jgi:hypothetical protein